MKKTLKLIAMLLCVATMTSMWSCDTEQPSSSSNNQTSTPKETATPQKTGFTASDGRYYSFSKVEKESYDFGTSQGTRCQGFGYHFNDFGTEEYFKKHWVSYYGIPESPEAKDAYSRALKQYQEGYDAGYKF